MQQLFVPMFSNCSKVYAACILRVALKERISWNLLQLILPYMLYNVVYVVKLEMIKCTGLISGFNLFGSFKVRFCLFLTKLLFLIDLS